MWMIPVTDLLAAGLPPKMTKGTDPVQANAAPEAPPGASPVRLVELETQVQILTVKLEAERALREAAERNSSDLRQSLRMLERTPVSFDTVEPVPTNVYTPQRRWWQRGVQN